MLKWLAHLFGFGLKPAHSPIYFIRDDGLPTVPAQNLQVLIWNIYKARGRGFGEDLQTVATGQHLMLLQEGIISEKMLSPLPYHQSWHMGVSFDYRSHETGVVTGGAHPQHLQVIVADEKEPFFNLPKVTLVTSYKIQGRDDTLLVLNIHGLNFTTDKAWKKQLEPLIDIISHHKGPVIWAGDFNTKNQERHEHLGEVADMLKMAKLKLSGAREYDQVLVRGFQTAETFVNPLIKSSNHLPISFVGTMVEQ